MGRPTSGTTARTVRCEDVLEHDEDVQDTKGHGRNREEVAGGDLGHVIGEKRSPSLRRRPPGADHILGHGPFGSDHPWRRLFGLRQSISKWTRHVGNLAVGPTTRVVP